MPLEPDEILVGETQRGETAARIPLTLESGDETNKITLPLFRYGALEGQIWCMDGSMRGVARLVDLIRNADSVYDSYAPIFPNGCRILLLGPTVFSPEISVKRPGHALANSAEESKLLAEKFKRVAEEKNIYFLDESKYAYPSDRDCIHLLPEDHERLGICCARRG